MKAGKIFSLMIVSVAVPLALAGQEPTIQIQLDSASFLFGQPVYARYTVSNLADLPIYIGVYSDDKGQSKLLRWNAEAFRPNGQLVPYHKDYAKYVGEEETHLKRALKNGESFEIYQPIPVTDVSMPELKPGPYKLQFTLNYSLSNEGRLWEKEKKEVADFRIAEPLGEDAKYLDELWKSIQQSGADSLMRPDKTSPLRWNEVLQPPIKGFLSNLLVKHPTSIYAACLIYESMRAFVTSNWHIVANDISNSHTGCRSLPDDTGKMQDGWQTLTFDQEMKWWDKWIGIVLKNHPDIWFAGELKLKRAVDLVRQGKYDAGAADLQMLAGDTKGPVACAAKEFLGIMKEKGWQKSELVTPEKAVASQASPAASLRTSQGGS